MKTQNKNRLGNISKSTSIVLLTKANTHKKKTIENLRKAFIIDACVHGKLFLYVFSVDQRIWNHARLAQNATFQFLAFYGKMTNLIYIHR